MKKLLQLPVFMVGVAIFSMLFGAANLFFPIKVGLTAGQHLTPAMLGFLLTAVFLPLLGMIAIMLFDGNYQMYFERLGRVPGKLLILLCILIIGPIIAIPRLVTLSYQMLQPLLPQTSFMYFSILFLVVALICSFKQEWIVPLLGYFFGPIILILLGIILIKGIMLPHISSVALVDTGRVFVTNVKYGFATLDLLGTIFLGSLVLAVLKQDVKYASRQDVPNFALACILAGIIGALLMAVAYSALMYLGSAYAVKLANVPDELLFTSLAMRIVGPQYWFIIIGGVLAACISTTIALIVVVARYIHEDLFNMRLAFVPSVLAVGILSFFACYWGVHYIARITYGPVALVLYPIVIMLTLCNLGYKIFGMRSVRTPVFFTFIAAVLFCIYYIFLR